MADIQLDPEPVAVSMLVRSFLKGTLKEMMRCLGAECGSLFLFNGSTEELVLDSFYNSHPLAVEGVRRKKGEGVSGRMIALRQPVLVKDIKHDLHFCANGFGHYRSGSFMSIPLFCGKSFVALINLADKNGSEAFSGQDLAFAVSLGKYAALIMEQQSALQALRTQRQSSLREQSSLEQYASVGKLASGIVHEIAGPLDGAIRFADLLGRLLEQQSAEEYLREIKKGLLRIKNIATGLVGFGRHGVCSDAERRQRRDLAAMIDEALDYFSAPSKGLVVIRKEYRSRPLVEAEAHLAYVFINLIKNALDAMPQAGTLCIRLWEDDQSAFVSFKDSGAGIDLRVMDRIFEPFFTTKGHEQGAGLGLAICKEIVGRHGGTIQAESTCGKGATFTVALPLEQARCKR